MFVLIKFSCLSLRQPPPSISLLFCTVVGGIHWSGSTRLIITEARNLLESWEVCMCVFVWVVSIAVTDDSSDLFARTCSQAADFKVSIHFLCIYTERC